MKLPSTLLCLPLAVLNVSGENRAVLYMTSEAASVESFLAHAEKIDILIPTIYSADEKGVVTGSPDPRVLETARRRRVPVMPIIANPGFKRQTIHGLLGNPAARARAARSLLEECRRHQYYGIQLDFENIPAADREALTALVRDTAALFAPEGFRLSIAVMYQTSEGPVQSAYSRWLWDNWLGAYDLGQIAGHVEFISVMTYDQHTERTPPGPVAGFPWVEEALQHCLTRLPREKLSLGIPLYGRRWFAAAPAGEGAPATATVKAPEAIELAARMGVEPRWDERDRAPWFSFYRDGLQEYVFYNDARSFRERYQLARRRQLHGFSAWVLGAEDPDIWRELPEARR